MTHSGSCLCGAVRFEIEGSFERFMLCHCSRCRKGSGSAHGANLFSSTARLTWLTGQELTRRFQLPESRHSRCFCTQCGSALPYEMPGPYLVVPAGSLETELNMAPQAHIFTADRADWDQDLHTIAAFEQFPK